MKKFLKITLFVLKINSPLKNNIHLNDFDYFFFKKSTFSLKETSYLKDYLCTIPSHCTDFPVPQVPLTWRITGKRDVKE